ncbi:alkaline phosphatase D family protein [Streptomyces sp. NPDC005706]|uniref:alkaline phosphatase D family protein n=1 Tax=Streptomyces sp. NPDC005706 TaxID=3157169 RepID=UPI0033DBF687
MVELRLGPLLRCTDGSFATVWVETSESCTVQVRCSDGAVGTAPTFQVAGHHYALVTVTGLRPGASPSYEVLLDDTTVWPLADSPFPPSVIRSPATGGTVRVTFGSCRWAAPPARGKDPIGPDALDTLATRLATDPDAERPDVLLLLGDQIYADETSEQTRRWLAGRRDLDQPPGGQVTDYEEYCHLYYESWLDPEIRWLLSTVPSLMIFDDHDVVDDWNTSAAWLADMRTTDWWQERLLSGLMSYWVYQHLGNLSPAELADDPAWTAVHAAPDGTPALRALAERADADSASVRFSYRRDFGQVRIVMVDSRAARVLAEERRAMLDPGEAAWLREQVLSDEQTYDHLLIGTSLPWLLPHLVHDAETWNAALCAGERGKRWARFGEWLRRGADLEHWAAFPRSFADLADLIAEAGSAPASPATVCVLSGDVHHGYLAKASWRSGGPHIPVVQLTCSPVHNSVSLMMRIGFRFGWSAPARLLGRLLTRHGHCPRPPVSWRKQGGPWFGNQLMTLTLRDRSAHLRLERTTSDATLHTVHESVLTDD